MKPGTRWLNFGVPLTMILILVGAATAGNVDNFTLSKAIPADAMIVVHARNHDGMTFVNAQYDRVWEAIQRQRFDKDLRRLMQGLLRNSDGDVAAFEQRWQQINDLAAVVNWSKLTQRESAFAMKLALPHGADYVFLMMPAKDEVADDFKGLGAIVKNLVELAPPDTLQFATQGEGTSIVHTLTVPNMMPPMRLTLAREQDVILIGFGSMLTEQSLALLKGANNGSGATLCTTPRFQQAFNDLPAPRDALYFVDVDKIMAQSRGFAKMIGGMAAAEMSGDANGPDPGKILTQLVDALDVYDYMAGSTTTDGMKTTTEEVAKLKSDGPQRPLYRVLYGHGPVEQPLKYIPQPATDVSVVSGIDLRALYTEVLSFVESNVPDGAAAIAQIKAVQANAGFDIEKDLLSWIGGTYASFSAPIPTPFLPGWVWIVKVTDEEQALLALDRLYVMIDEAFMAEGGGVEDARIEAAPGFKRIILPVSVSWVPGLGRPIMGVKDGYLFLGNGPEVVTAALNAGSSAAPNFSQNERYQQEGLPLKGPVTAFSYTDLSKIGESLGQLLPALAFGARMAAQDAARDPLVNTALTVLTKAGDVARTFDFLESSCSVTTFADGTSRTKTVTHYQRPGSDKTSSETTSTQE